MANAHELRFAVGESSGRRSTVWKIWTRKSDVYILTRMFGADAKVSLHASGECQWSATETWMKRNPGHRNAQRHISRWTLPPLKASEANHVFRIQIPESELRCIENDEKLNEVVWLSPPPLGKSTLVECYLTPVCTGDPTTESKVPHSLLRSFPLSAGRWLV